MEIKKRKQISAKSLGAQKVETAKTLSYGKMETAKTNGYSAMVGAKTLGPQKVESAKSTELPGLTIKKKNMPSAEAKTPSFPSIKTNKAPELPSIKANKPVVLPSIKTNKAPELPSIKANTGGVQKRKIEGAPIDVVADSSVREQYLKRMKKREK